MVYQYDRELSWSAYQFTVERTIENVGVWDKQLDAENVYPAIEIQVADPDGDPWNKDEIKLYPNEGDIDTNTDNYRSLEKNTLFASSDSGVEFRITYSMRQEAKIEAAINLARTCWVIIVLTIAAIHFSNATNRLVLHPLERMLEIVKQIAKDPASAAAQDEMANAGIFMFLNQQDKDKKKKLD